jgi:hypothetical protein
MVFDYHLLPRPKCPFLVLGHRAEDEECVFAHSLRRCWPPDIRAFFQQWNVDEFNWHVWTVAGCRPRRISMSMIYRATMGRIMWEGSLGVQ